MCVDAEELRVSSSYTISDQTRTARREPLPETATFYEKTGLQAWYRHMYAITLSCFCQVYSLPALAKSASFFILDRRVKLAHENTTTIEP